MNTRRLIVLGGILLVPLAACPAPSPADDMPGADASSPPADAAMSLADLTPGPDMRKLRDMTPPPSGCVKGVLLDENSKALASIDILACSATDCVTTKTFVDGAFNACGLKLVPLGVKSQEVNDVMPRLAEVIVPAYLKMADQVIDLGNVYQPILGAGAAPANTASPQTLAIGDGLQLSFRLGDLDPALGANLSLLAARHVAAAHRPTFDVGAETVLGTYALYPFGTKARLLANDGGPPVQTVIGVTAPIDTVLPAGTVVNLRTVNELDGTMSPPATGKVKVDGTVTTDPGQGITNTTWLVISR